MTSERIQRRIEELSAHGYPTEQPTVAPDPLNQSTRDLIREIGDQIMMLARKEIELARAEAKSDAEKEVEVAKAIGVAGVCALLAANMLLLTLVFALSSVIPPAVTSLILAVVLGLAAVILGRKYWDKRVRSPLDTTLETLKEDLRWAKRSFRRV